MNNNNKENNLIFIPKKYKKDEYAKTPFIVNNTEITLPQYVINSISKYAFSIIDNTILLHRKCNTCSKFIQVQKYNNGTFDNLPNLGIGYKGEISGFESYCNSCLPNKTNLSTCLKSDADDMVQINIKVDLELKKFYRILAAKNNTKLNVEFLNALIFYKNHNK